MVTASKLAPSARVDFSARAGDSTRLPSTECGGLRSHDFGDSLDFDETVTVESANDMLADLPVGEQLVLETYLRCRQRTYDRQRVEELARPRKLAQPPQCAPSPRVDRTEMDAIISRLTRQKSRKGPVAHLSDEALQSALERQCKQKRMTPLDLQGLIERLATVKPPKVIAKQPIFDAEAAAIPRSTRSLDSARIAALATPRRRGATCASWGVPDDWTLPAIHATGCDAVTEPQQKQHAVGVDVSLPDICTGGDKDSHDV